MRDLLDDLQERAFTDALTGLPNRSAFSERVETALARRTPGEGIALLFVDIDHFKQINDVMGHACGDALLAGIAERLRSCIRPGDLVARFGGDEFTILLESLDSVERADVALYRSKIDGRDRHTIFVETMTEGALELLHLESDLRRPANSASRSLKPRSCRMRLPPSTC